MFFLYKLEVREHHKRMTGSIFIARTRTDLERCFPIMKELRPHLNLKDFFTIYEKAHQMDGYEIIGIKEGPQIVAIMGYRTLYDYVRGKYIYIDDLVSSEKMRSKGYGARLLQYAEEAACEQGCATLRLCTGLDNEGGIKFYEKNGWVKRSFAYVKKLS